MILYSTLIMYILLFTQAPIPVCLDGTIIDSSTILLQCTTTVVMLGYDWWLCMVIYISVQYNGGFLPDTILLTQGYYHWGTRLNAMWWLCIYSLCNSILLLSGVMVYYIVSVLFLLFFWCPCMAINVHVQYNGGLLPDIILLLTQCYLHRGTCLNAMKRFCICSL